MEQQARRLLRPRSVTTAETARPGPSAGNGPPALMMAGHNKKQEENAMTRYQIVYSKRGIPLTAWMDSADAAHKFADGLRKTGLRRCLGAHQGRRA